MPDISTPESPKITPKEVLQYGSETRTGPTISSETLEKQKRLRALKEKGATGKEVITAARETRDGSFSTNQAAGMELYFGAGKAKEGPSTATGPPTTELDSTKNPDIAEKNSYETAKQLIEGVNNYIQYADITAEAGRRNKSIDVVIRERVAKGDTSISNTRDFINARETGLSLILQSSTVQELFPELSALNDGARRRYIEETLAKDPVMRNEVVKLMKNIAVDAQKLPDVTTNEDYAKAQKDKDEAEPKLAGIKQYLIDELNKDIKTGGPLTVAQEDTIKNWLDQGMTAEQISRSIKGLILNDTNIPKLQFFQNIEQLRNQQESLRASLSNPKTDALKANASIAKLNQDILDYQSQNNLTNQEINDYFDMLTKYSDKKDPTGTFVSGLTQRASEGSALGKLIRTSEDTISRKGADSQKSEKASKNARLAAEQDLIDRLENVMADAAASTLERRYDELEGLEKKALTEDREKQNNSDDEAIKKAMETRWIRYDPNTRSKDSNTAQINTDVRMLAYEGEDGVKRLLVRELGFTLVDEDGNPIPGPVDYRTVDLSKLSEDQKKRLEEAYSKHGETLRNKLFKDMFLARTLGSKLKDRMPGTNKIGLKKHEWELLEQNFSGKLFDAISKSKEAQGIIKNLEAQGIRPDFKMKWLIWLAAILGVGAVAGIGIAPMAVAAGTAGKTAGGAAWSGIL